MKFEFTVPSVKIKSSWFDKPEGRKKNTYQKIGYKGLNTYFQLYKFKQHRQELFITSIALLRKETGYSTEETFELLKGMSKAKIIKVNNISRWDYLINEDSSIKDKECLIITPIDLPVTERAAQQRNNAPVTDENGVIKMIDKPIDEDNYYIAVSFKMLERYKEKKLNERYYALYCLALKWSNGYVDGRFNMKIEKIALVLDMDKDTIHRMIYQLNRNYFMATYRQLRKAKNGYMFIHYILTSPREDDVVQFLSAHKETIDKLIKRADKKKGNKKKTNMDDIAEIIEEVEEEFNNLKNHIEDEPNLAFGKRHEWGMDRPFKDEEYSIQESDIDEWDKLFG